MFSAIVSGARGYVLKQTRSVELVRTLDAVGRGESMFDSAVTGMVLERIRRIASGAYPDESVILTAREREILPLIAAGHTNREIADAVFLSDKTVKNYVSSILSKLGLERRTQVPTYMATHDPMPARSATPDAGSLNRVRQAVCGARVEAPALLHHDLQVLHQAGREAGLAQRQVVLPHPDEPLVEALGPHRGEVLEEPRPPRPQRPRVVGRDVARLADQQPGAVRRLLDDRQRRAQAAREDVGLDPVRPAALGLVGGVGERDHLEAQPAARPQRPVARPRSTSCSTRRPRPRASRSTRSRRTGRRCRGSRGAGCPPGAPARPPGPAPGRGRAAPPRS